MRTFRLNLLTCRPRYFTVVMSYIISSPILYFEKWIPIFSALQLNQFVLSSNFEYNNRKCSKNMHRYFIWLHFLNKVIKLHKTPQHSQSNVPKSVKQWFIMNQSVDEAVSVGLTDNKKYLLNLLSCQRDYAEKVERFNCVWCLTSTNIYIAI